MLRVSSYTTFLVRGTGEVVEECGKKCDALTPGGGDVGKWDVQSFGLFMAAFISQ